jgi:branched-chain amino acid transport system permease protein
MLAQQLVNGVVLGATYALIAIGYTLIFGILRVLHLAHGEVFVAGALAGVAVTAASGGSLALALAASVAAAVGAGILVERVALRPLRAAGHLAPILSTLGVAVIVQDLAVKAFGGEPIGFPEFAQPRVYKLGPLTVSGTHLAILAITALLVAGLHLLLRRTRLGRALRATAESPTLAALLGIRTRQVAFCTIVVASALAGAAGLLVGLATNVVLPSAGFEVTLKGLVVMLFGGVGSVAGALAGGIILGLAEVLSVAYLASSYRDAFAFLLLIAVLLVRPRGLFGARGEGA